MMGWGLIRQPRRGSTDTMDSLACENGLVFWEEFWNLPAHQEPERVSMPSCRIQGKETPNEPSYSCAHRR
jgi:hypothetical protein